MDTATATPMKPLFAAGTHVLVADEDAETRSRICEYLGQHDFRVTAVDDGNKMLDILGREAIDLLLLEPRLRGSEGIGLTRSIRETSKLPIVVLSALREEADCVMGLELGADDYVTKPFSPRELLARIRAVLRRSQATLAGSPDRSVRAYRFGGWELNVRLHRLLSPAGARVPISRGEFSLLCAFLSQPQRILTRDQLLDMSRLHSTEVYDRSIDVQILRLRRKIEAHPATPRFFRTERGTGYFFDALVATVR
ncbi:response regulator [Povalibacter sp.]|uniref:response regulator n=1 Tax=Povalibacter sp. TaxID=1962978 RepID=UPI002F3F019E